MTAPSLRSLTLFGGCTSQISHGFLIVDMNNLGFVESPTASLKMEPSSCTVRILVADDHDAWRGKIRQILDSRPEWNILGESCDGVEAVRKAMKLRPHVVLLDIGMPHLNGIAAARSIHQKCPACKVVFVTLNGDPDIRSAALDSGARGYVLKANAATELVPAIERAFRDGHTA